MTFFWILWGFDALIALIFIGFFLVGLADGSVSSFNIMLWLGILAGLAAVLLGSLYFKQHNLLGLAKSLLSVLAVPGFLFFLMSFLTVFVKSWR